MQSLKEHISTRKTDPHVTYGGPASDRRRRGLGRLRFRRGGRTGRTPAVVTAARKADRGAIAVAPAASASTTGSGSVRPFAIPGTAPGPGTLPARTTEPFSGRAHPVDGADADLGIEPDGENEGDGAVLTLNGAPSGAIASGGLQCGPATPGVTTASNTETPAP